MKLILFCLLLLFAFTFGFCFCCYFVCPLQVELKGYNELREIVDD